MSDISEFWKAVTEYVPLPKSDVEYRLYYDGDNLLYVTMADEPGDYIVLMKEQYTAYRPGYHKIKDGKLLTVTPLDSFVLQLEKVEDGVYCTAKDNMIFLADEGDQYSKIIRYT